MSGEAREDSRVELGAESELEVSKVESLADAVEVGREELQEGEKSARVHQSVGQEPSRLTIERTSLASTVLRAEMRASELTAWLLISAG